MGILDFEDPKPPFIPKQRGNRFTKKYLKQNIFDEDKRFTELNNDGRTDDDYRAEPKE